MNEIKIETREEMKHLLRNIGTLPAGNYKVKWYARGFASGLYYYRLKTDEGHIQTRKLILLK